MSPLIGDYFIKAACIMEELNQTVREKDQMLDAMTALCRMEGIGIAVRYVLGIRTGDHQMAEWVEVFTESKKVSYDVERCCLATDAYIKIAEG